VAGIFDTSSGKLTEFSVTDGVRLLVPMDAHAVQIPMNRVGEFVQATTPQSTDGPYSYRLVLNKQSQPVFSLYCLSTTAQREEVRVRLVEIVLRDASMVDRLADMLAIVYQHISQRYASSVLGETAVSRVEALEAQLVKVKEDSTTRVALMVDEFTAVLDRKKAALRIAERKIEELKRQQNSQTQQSEQHHVQDMSTDED
jgi:hypothetical protein